MIRINKDVVFEGNIWRVVYRFFIIEKVLRWNYCICVYKNVKFKLWRIIGKVLNYV